jgi:hypothetical protein
LGSFSVFFGNVSGTGTFTGGGTRVFEGGVSSVAAIDSTGSTAVESSATVTAAYVRQGELSVRGRMTLDSSGPTHVVGALTVEDGGTLNLTNDRLVVQDGSEGTWTGASYNGITGLITSGRNGGPWNGDGIMTNMIAAVGPTALTTIGIASAGAVGKTSFGGVAVASDDVLLMYTYAGDANLTGLIEGDDFFRIDQGYSTRNSSAPLLGYVNGDFNYSGRIDADDYWLIDRNYSRQSGTLGSEPVAGASSVPEPVTGGVAFVMLGLMIRRRRVLPGGI